MRTLVIEPSADGHRLAWARLLLGASPDVDLAVGPRAPDEAEFDHHLGDIPRSRIHILSSPEHCPAQVWLAAADLCKALQPDQVVVQTFDDLDRELGFEGFQTDGQQVAILMRGIPIPRNTPEARERQSRIDRLAASQRSGTFARALTLCAFSDPRAQANPEQWVPDPPVLLTRVGALSRQVDDKAPYALVAGQLAERKRTGELIRMWPAVYRATGVRLMLAGRTEPGFETRFDRDAAIVSHAVDIRRGHLSDIELASLVASATCYVACYRDRFVPSGLVAHCMAVGTPVVSVGSSYLGEFVRLAGGFHTLEASAVSLTTGVEYAVRHPAPAPMLTAAQDALSGFVSRVLGMGIRTTTEKSR